MTNGGLNSPWPELDGKNFQVSSGISFTKEELEKSGKKIAPEVGRVDGLLKGIDGLSVPFPHFGVIGWGVQTVHEEAIKEQREALARARRALDSWMPALKTADANYAAADDSGGPRGPGGPDMSNVGGPGDFGGLGNVPRMEQPDLPTGPGGPTGGPDLPETPKMPDVPKPDMPEAPKPNTPDIPKPDMPDSNLPGAPDGTVPDRDLPGIGDLPQQNLPTDPADMRVPDIDSALNDPSRTDLSSNQPTIPQIPSNLPVGDPSQIGTRTGPGSFGGTSPGTGMGANGGLQNAALRAGGGGGMPGAPMMPFMPMGAGAGGDQNRDREKTVGLSEEESVWTGDEDIAPEVIGQEDV